MEKGVIVKLAAEVASKRSDDETRLSIWLVDYDDICCEYLMWLLNAEPRVDCSRSFSTATALLATLRQQAPPDVILLNVQMPDMNSIEAIRPIKHLAPSASVVVLATFYDWLLKNQALEAGAADFVLKRNPRALIVAAVRAPSARFGREEKFLPSGHG